MNGRAEGAPLTVFWRLMITLAAVVGVGTCAVLGLLYLRFFQVVPGTVEVLEHEVTQQDAVPAVQDDEGDARIGAARFLAVYEPGTYYVAPGPFPGVVCLVGMYPWNDEVPYWEACHDLGDGRDILVEVPDPDNRTIILVPDQFDHRPLERAGWVTLHRNLLVQPLTGAREPVEPLTRTVGHQENVP